MRLVFCALLLAALPSYGVEIADNFTLSGWNALYLGVSGYQRNVAPAEVDAYIPLGTAQEAFRLKLFYKPKDFFSAELAWQAAPTLTETAGSETGSFFAPSAADFRITDAPDSLYNGPQGHTTIPHNLDRLNVSFSLPFLDLFLGRQAISFGAAKFINPTDIFSPFSFQELNREDKTGVDAVRIKVPIGEMSELDGGYIFGPDGRFSQSAAFLRGKFTVWETDVTLMLVEYLYNLMAGISIERSIGGAGVWLEAAYTADGAIKGRTASDDFFRLTAGATYNFACNLVLFGEYHYSSAGELYPSDYFSNLGKAAYTESGVYLLGQHYLSIGLSYEIIPLLNFSAQLLANLTDGSLLISPRLEYSLADDIFLDVGGYAGAGLTARKEVFFPVPRSEFGVYPYTIYSRVRIYF